MSNTKPRPLLHEQIRGLKNNAVGEPQYRVTYRLKLRIAPRRARLPMHTTVELGDQAQLRTAEVSNVGSHGVLAAELEPP